MKRKVLSIPSIPEMTEKRAHGCQLSGQSSAWHLQNGPQRRVLWRGVLTVFLSLSLSLPARADKLQTNADEIVIGIAAGADSP
jgi:hypothetical protein